MSYSFLVVDIFPSKDERVRYFCVGKLPVWDRWVSCQVLLVIQGVFRKILLESTRKSLMTHSKQDQNGQDYEGRLPTHANHDRAWC